MDINKLNSLVELYFNKTEEVDGKRPFLKWLKPGKPSYNWEDITQRIFNVSLNKFQILTHPNSYVHAIVKFNNGLTKILVHDTDMKIPIFNSIYDKSNKKIKSKNLDLNKLNNLNLNKIDTSRFPSVKIIKIIPSKISLFETVLVSANDELVSLFLNKKINFNEIVIFLKKILGMKIFLKLKKRSPKNYNELINLRDIVRLKTRALCI